MPSNTTNLDEGFTTFTSVQVLSRFSVGNSSNSGSAIAAFSTISCLGVAMVVQGSASSFSILAWPAVKAGDCIVTTGWGGPGISSLSSGLVLHSHATQAGQIEVRWSNVSTLVQNQSAITYSFARISAP